MITNPIYLILENAVPFEIRMKRYFSAAILIVFWGGCLTISLLPKLEVPDQQYITFLVKFISATLTMIFFGLMYSTLARPWVRDNSYI